MRISAKNTREKTRLQRVQTRTRTTRKNQPIFHAICCSSRKRFFAQKTAICFVLKLDHLPMLIIILHKLLIIKTVCLSGQIPPYCRNCKLFEISILINFENCLIDNNIEKKNNTKYWRAVTFFCIMSIERREQHFLFIEKNDSFFC